MHVSARLMTAGLCRREKGSGDSRSQPGGVQPVAHLRRSSVQGTSEMLPFCRARCCGLAMCGLCADVNMVISCMKSNNR